MSEAREVKRVRKRVQDFHHGDLRAAAIALTIKEVEKHGHTDISLERIAARLGVTRPALYRHFADKRALLAEVAQVGFERFEACITDAFFSQPDIWDALLALGCAYIDFARANPGWFRLQFSHPIPHPDLERAPARYQAPMHAALGRALAGDAAEADAAYRALWGVAHGLAALVVEGLPMPYEDALRIQVRGLAAYAASRR